jgi:myosin regulatory light chain 12
MGEKKPKKEKKEKEAAPAEEAADEPAAAAPKKKTGNVMAMFNQQQIQEFKEAFTMMDQDRDGIINEEDLSAIYQQVGRDPDPAMLKTMIAESPGQLNFTHFLTLFGEKTAGTDPEPKVRDAFKMFDEKNEGFLSEEYIKDLLMNVGDPFSKDEIKQVWKEAPIEGGKMDYLKFVAIIKRGKDDE